jgi:hypothetical protein
VDISPKYRIPRIQSIEFEKVNKFQGPSEDISIPLGREKKAVMGGRKRNKCGFERQGGGGKKNMIRFGGGWREALRARRMNGNMQPQRGRRWGYPLEYL